MLEIRRQNVDSRAGKISSKCLSGKLIMLGLLCMQYFSSRVLVRGKNQI